MSFINECIEELEKLKLNIKKSKNRIYEEKYREGKLGRLAFLKQSVEEFTKDSEDKNIETLKTEFEILHKELIEIIENINIKKKDTEQDRQEGNLPKMADFDISMVSKNLQVFKGSYEYLEDFITQSELLHDLIKQEDREIFVKYIYNFKLSVHVRSILGRSNRPVTFDDLKKALESAFPNPKTLQQVLTELGTTKQDKSSISDFRKKIAELSDHMSNFEIKNLPSPTQEAKDAIYKVSDSVALNVFIKGVNVEYQPLLLANMPKTLNEAVERCMTAERNLGVDNVNLFRIDSRSSNNFRKNNGFNNNYRNNNGFNNNCRNNNSSNNNYRKNNGYNNNYRNSDGSNNNYRNTNGANNNFRRNNGDFGNNNYNNKNNGNRSFKNSNYNQNKNPTRNNDFNENSDNTNKAQNGKNNAHRSLHYNADEGN